MSTVLVTGANRGIGLALVSAYADRGDTVIATVRNPDRLHDLATVIESRPDRIEVHRLEVTDAGSIAALAERLAGRPIDVLINNAGTIGPDHQSTADMDYDGWLTTFRINTLAPLAVARALLPNLRLSDRGKILTISSGMGSMSTTNSDHVAYRASKAAVNKEMQCLATDLAEEGIAVAVCHPGWVRTEMGGENADISPEVSATGIQHVVDRLALTRTPVFHVWDGGVLPWCARRSAAVFAGARNVFFVDRRTAATILPSGLAAAPVASIFAAVGAAVD
ncbi:MAG: SDR family oxidoreductase [Phyllobacteriaceae bacterium]|nr:SDR family oxidoreductase [Phyllobacteriaceae bacterium]